MLNFSKEFLSQLLHPCALCIMYCQFTHGFLSSQTLCADIGRNEIYIRRQSHLVCVSNHHLLTLNVSWKTFALGLFIIGQLSEQQKCTKCKQIPSVFSVIMTLLHKLELQAWNLQHVKQSIGRLIYSFRLITYSTEPNCQKVFIDIYIGGMQINVKTLNFRHA